MKQGDKILFIIITAVLVIVCLQFLIPGTYNKTVVIRSAGPVIKRIPLTGNKTEISVGYNTLYGDTVGGIAPIGDLYKDEVYGLANYINETFNQPIPDNIIKKAPSAELRKNQRDEDDLPPYPVLNKALKMLIEENLSIKEIIRKGIDKNLLEEILKRYYNSEYKRKQLPITLKISPKAFGIGRKIPLTKGFKQ